MKGKTEADVLIDSISHSLTLLQTPFASVHLAAAIDAGEFSTEDLCTLLPAHEVSAAGTREDADERRHILFRRVFQRLFVARTIGWKQPLASLTMRHATDTRPYCEDAPRLTLSFSSSRNTCLAAAATDAELGIDIEEHRVIDNAPAIAARFFTAEEAELVRAAPEEKRDEIFQTIWCAKEAGLKAKGLGIVDGLNNFTLKRSGGQWQVNESGSAKGQVWRIWFAGSLPRHIVAVMHRSGTNSRVR